MEGIIHEVNKTLRGWGHYFRHGAYSLEWVNSWVRQRLRAILRRRTKRPGYPTVWDKKRWPNACFAKAGLHNLRTDPQLKLPIQNLAFQLESRMREIRPSGLEGGVAQPNAPSLPLFPR